MSVIDIQDTIQVLSIINIAIWDRHFYREIRHLYVNRVMDLITPNLTEQTRKTN